MVVWAYGHLQHLPKTWSGPLWDGPYRPQKWSGPDPRSGWKSTPLAIRKNEINVTVATCCAELEAKFTTSMDKFHLDMSLVIIVCGHHGLWPSWFVAVMVCGRHSRTPNIVMLQCLRKSPCLQVSLGIHIHRI